MAETTKSNPPEFPTQPTGPVKTYHGSCHCGNIKYEVDLPEDLTKAVHGKCNCTICTKANYHHITPPDIKTFKLTGPKDQSTLGKYSCRAPDFHSAFCKICGIRIYTGGNVPAFGGEVLFFNLYTLDDVDLGVMKCTRYVDGKSESWMIKETPIPPGGW